MASSLDLDLFCDGLVSTYLGRGRRPADGVCLEEVQLAETRLGRSLPAALRALYLRIGALEELCLVHNVVRRPDELSVEQGYLVFMDENQGVVSWGVPEDDRAADPDAWQRSNTEPVEWFSEEMTLTGLLRSMLDWYRETGILAPSPDSRLT